MYLSTSASACAASLAETTRHRSGVTNQWNFSNHSGARLTSPASGTRVGTFPRRSASARSRAPRRAKAASTAPCALARSVLRSFASAPCDDRGGTRVACAESRSSEPRRAVARAVPRSAFVFPAAASTRVVGIGIGIAFPRGGGGGGDRRRPPMHRIHRRRPAFSASSPRGSAPTRDSPPGALADAPRHRVPRARLLRDGPFEVAPALPPASAVPR